MENRTKFSLIHNNRCKKLIIRKNQLCLTIIKKKITKNKIKKSE